ncbi:MAG: CDP-glycerol glycerophosphotransferase family protein [Lachnospiraceae bacterium]|nr:CDP-glycerol glycerophosphotransferase family protein [Lachnospiraceae bacterium]
MSVKHIAKQYVKMIVQGSYLPSIYKKAAASPIDEKKVIFADAHNHSTPYSMRRMEDACRAAGFRVETHYSDYQKDGVAATYRAMREFMESYATASAVVISDTFLPVASCKKRPETKVVQLWHGAGALKKFGYATTDDVPAYYKGNIYENYSLITVSGEPAVDPFALSMRAEKGVTRPIGVSRTDNYFDEDYMADMRQKVRAAYPEAVGKKVALYAPTFRGHADAAGLAEPEAVAKRLRSELSDEWYLISSAHPHARGKGGDHGISSFCTEELMLIADVLITDYSSIVFDYLFLHRPVILYAPDYESFGRLRGFYTPYEELPGRIVTDPRQLSAAIKSECENYDDAKTRAYLVKYLGACDGHATERIVEYLK